jgi:hypothetical protein
MEYYFQLQILCKGDQERRGMQKNKEEKIKGKRQFKGKINAKWRNKGA